MTLEQRDGRAPLEEDERVAEQRAREPRTQRGLLALRVLIVDEPAPAPKPFQPTTMCGLGSRPPVLLEPHATLPEFLLAASLRPTEPGTRPALARADDAAPGHAASAETVRVRSIILLQHAPAPTAPLATPPTTAAPPPAEPPPTAAPPASEPVGQAALAVLDSDEPARAEATALQSLSSEQQAQELPTPRRRAFFIAVLTGLLAAISFGLFGKLDVIGRGRGILRSPGGAQTLSAAMSGTVQRLHVHSGDKVAPGQALLTLDASALQAELQQASQNLELAQKRSAELSDQRELHERSLELLRSAASLTQRRLRGEDDTLRTLAQRSTASLSIPERGFEAHSGMDEIREQMHSVERSKLALEQELAQTQLQQVLLEREQSEQLQRARADLDAAQSKRNTLEAQLAQTSVHAPSAGRVEELARVGDQVQLGQPLLTLVPVTAPTQVVAFAAERDRAFLRVGSPARLEVDQLPMAEFGVLTGKVSSIGAHFASLRERLTTLGEEPTALTPCYRVEVQLAQTKHNRELLDRLSSGALVSVRFRLRQRRLITLVLEPLRALLTATDD